MDSLRGCLEGGRTLMEFTDTTKRVLARLKDFQRITAEYVFRRFYLDPDPTDRFLVADEVGLGKTLVASGVVALAMEHLRRLKPSERIDVVYICSNVSIASQNITRLNVTQVQEFVRPTRLSLLPMHIAGIRDNHVNFIGLTPGTSFDPQSRDGKDEERALIYHVLKGKLDINRAGLRRLLRGRVGKEHWRTWTREWRPDSLDRDASNAFISSISSDTAFHERMKGFCELSEREMWKSPERLNLISELRCRMAEVSVEMLEPDLIILDEFQRFKDLLDHTNPEARLAQKLFQYRNVKTLLLSATPYKMLSLDHEQEDDHYPDFLKTLRFLFDSDEAEEDLKKEILAFRRSLYLLDAENGSSVSQSRDSLQSRLCRVMCRTERVGLTQRQDAMLSESEERPAIQSCDLHEVVLADKVASCVGAQDIIEYWKSSPYLINFLRRYEFRRRLEEHCNNASEGLISIFGTHGHRLLRKEDIQAYQEIKPVNPRMRYLFSKTIDRGLWKILWLPPSMPYSKPEGPYSDVNGATKYLVFSAWNVVPDAIAALCSYEAERGMLASYPKRVSHHRLYEEIRPLLRYAVSDGRLTGMSALCLFYPSPGLASLVDPLRIALADGADNLVTSSALQDRATESLRPHIAPFLAGATDKGPEDQRWYWAMPALLDSQLFPAAKSWVLDDKTGWPSLASEFRRDPGERFREHLYLLRQTMDRKLEPPLGRPPEDLVQVLARMAVAGPGICALRSLRRMAPNLDWANDALLSGAARIAEGFRTLFNIPESIALLRGDNSDEYYWQLALRHCLEGNIQALLDEQSHCLVDSLGVFDKPESERVRKIAEALGTSLSLRTAQMQLDEVLARPETGRIDFESFNTRCRFALRFAEIKDEEGAVARADIVRDAFNSPFRPFILASTSVGQEGLDFHTWCHAVVHWNLPSNPVDLEQREGRIHRYKGHAIRKNVAMAYGLRALREKWDGHGDPWRFMFGQARNDRPNDLLCYWLFEPDGGGARIERHVPILSYSREEPHFKRLKKMLAVYRLVFGQPRQEDLLAYLADKAGDSQDAWDPNNWRISLAPPAKMHIKSSEES